MGVPVKKKLGGGGADTFLPDGSKMNQNII